MGPCLKIQFTEDEEFGLVVEQVPSIFEVLGSIPRYNHTHNPHTQFLREIEYVSSAYIFCNV